MTSKNTHLDFWERVEQTPPKMTKTATVSGQVRTSVDAQFKKKMITRAFGMFGRGWGVVADSERYERITHGETTLIHYQATAFYVYDGERYTFPISAAIREAYITNKGYLKIDDEAVKKVRTDALTKGFTDLGFCADIHMGMFDDQSYVQGANARSEIEEAERRDAAIQEAKEKLVEYCASEIDAILKIKSEPAFKAALNKVKQNVQTRCIAAGINPAPYLKRLDERATEKVFDNDN